MSSFTRLPLRGSEPPFAAPSAKRASLRFKSPRARASCIVLSRKTKCRESIWIIRAPAFGPVAGLRSVPTLKASCRFPSQRFKTYMEINPTKDNKEAQMGHQRRGTRESGRRSVPRLESPTREAGKRPDRTRVTNNVISQRRTAYKSTVATGSPIPQPEL